MMGDGDWNWQRGMVRIGTGCSLGDLIGDLNCLQELLLRSRRRWENS
jgi:hypothetical protein